MNDTEHAAPSRRGGAGSALGLVAVLVVALAAASVLYTHERSAAARWRDRAVEAETAAAGHAEAFRAAAAETERAAADAERLVRALQASEADAAALEDRVAALAAEKEEAVDEARSAAGGVSGLHAASRSALEEAAEVLALCVDVTVGWAAARPLTGASPETWTAWSAEAEAVSAACSAASAQVGRVRSVASLLR